MSEKKKEPVQELPPELERVWAGVDPDEQLKGVMGGWPEEERDDGFEEAVLRWRQQAFLSGDDA